MLLTNPDGSPIEWMCTGMGYQSDWEIAFGQAVDAAVVGTLGVAFVVVVVVITRPKGLPFRFPKEFDYFVATTLGLWAFVISGVVLR